MFLLTVILRLKIFIKDTKLKNILVNTIPIIDFSDGVEFLLLRLKKSTTITMTTTITTRPPVTPPATPPNNEDGGSGPKKLK